MKQSYFLITLLFFSCANSETQKNSAADSIKEQKTSSESIVSFVVIASKSLEVHDVNGAVMFNIEKGLLRTDKNKKGSMANSDFVGKIDFGKTDLPINQEHLHFSFL